MDASYEKLGSFYLGKKYDLPARKLLDEIVNYDAKDLTTHAMCVGMTGSGKTGLCLALLEEAAIDGIPAICIDPKGDLGNLLLAFPDLKPEDFEEWIEEAEATRQGITRADLAKKTADRWRSGLSEWHQEPARIAKFKEAVDIAIYTPGGNAGLPMTVLRSFDAPPKELINDPDLFRERIAGAASGLLTLLGIDADPLTSREHILLSNIFNDAWMKGQSLELGALIRLIQTPPISKIGVFDLDSFFPAAERMKLAMSLNNLLASPSFAGWLEGQPLDVKSLLYTSTGKPRLTILSIAHLSDAERMFFVTIFLNELLAWMRTQPGTGSLRALFYMDEVYGYFPPTAKPPSKPPMMVLLKQARAFGLGIALATQNPVDLDYKGLANIGTWFLGRLQTERDKARVLEGLEGAAQQAGAKFDRNAMEQTLAALGNRVFLMNNVHDDGPTVFQSRWALSFLRGPLSRQDIQKLMAPRKQASAASAVAATSSSADASVSASPSTPVAPSVKKASPDAGRPILAADVPERFVEATRTAGNKSEIEYRPLLLGSASCHYVKASADLDAWVDSTWIAGQGGTIDDDVWENSTKLTGKAWELQKEPDANYSFADLPDALLAGRNYKRWQTELKDFIYRHEPARIFECEELKCFSQPGQDELDARLSLEHKMREVRDVEKEKLRVKYDAIVKTLEGKILTAQQKAEKEGSQFLGSAIDILGGTVLGMLLGNKRSRSTSTVRGLGKAAAQRTASQNAKEVLERLMAERAEVLEKAEAEIEELKNRYSVQGMTLTPVDIPCRKADTRVDLVALVWVPYAVDANGRAQPLVVIG